MRPDRLLAVLVAGVLAITFPRAGQAAGGGPSVLATIAPIHALTAAVMAGVGEPTLLVRGNASPHGYQLKPSDAQALEAADIVVRVGPALETFLERPLDGLAGEARVVTLMEAPGIRLLPAREGGAWEADERHDGDDHAHEHAHGEVDPHVWLDPANAQVMVQAIATALVEADPENAERYTANAEAATRALEALDAELRDTLEPVRSKPFVVLHDAYQYLEAAYGLHAAGSITVSPDRPPSARRLVALREKIEESGAACIFGEAQALLPIVATMIADLELGTGELDPEGSAGVEPGPDAYAQLMRRNARVLVDCLSRPR